MFDIVTTEVTAGSDVAFAHVLLRCCTPADLARRPGYWLRVTLGLRKEAGRWLVAHEHHSFPLADPPGDTDAEQQINTLHQR